MPNAEPGRVSSERRAQLTYRDDRMPETIQVVTFPVTEDEWRAIGEAQEATDA